MSGNSYKEIFESLKEYKDPNKYIGELVTITSQILFDRNLFIKSSEQLEQRLAFFKMLETKIEEAYQKYKQNYPNASDRIQEVEFIGAGHTHLAFRIGDMVLKVGKSNNQWTTKKMEEYKEYPCLIPVVDYECFIISDKEYYLMQLSPIVDTHNIEEEDVYKAYKELRGFGYIWNDPLPENTGRMMKEMDFNGHHYQQGDIVILDLEDMINMGDIPSEIVLEKLKKSYNQKAYLYEKRYEEETRRNNNVIHKGKRLFKKI